MIYLFASSRGSWSQSIASKLWGCIPVIIYKSGSELLDYSWNHSLLPLDEVNSFITRWLQRETFVASTHLSTWFFKYLGRVIDFAFHSDFAFRSRASWLRWALVPASFLASASASKPKISCYGFPLFRSGSHWLRFRLPDHDFGSHWVRLWLPKFYNGSHWLRLRSRLPITAMASATSPASNPTLNGIGISA